MHKNKTIFLGKQILYPIVLLSFLTGLIPIHNSISAPISIGSSGAGDPYYDQSDQFDQKNQENLANAIKNKEITSQEMLEKIQDIEKTIAMNNNSDAQAQESEKFTKEINVQELSKRIKIKGLERIERAIVFEAIRENLDEINSIKDTNIIIKKLYKTDYFEKVSVRLTKKDNIIIQVLENPMINEVIVGGVSKKISEQFAAGIPLSSRQIYTKDKVKTSVLILYNQLQSTGKLKAKITPRLERLSRNRVNVLFDIDDGEVSRVQSVQILGLQELGEKEALKETVNQKPNPYTNAIGAAFEEQSIESDNAKIVNIYIEKGYKDAKIDYSLSEYENESGNFNITLKIDEGEKYIIGGVSLESRMPDIEVKKLPSNLILQHTGDLFNSNEIVKTKQILSNYISGKGVSLVKIDCQVSEDKESKTVNLKFVIEQSEEIYIESIDIYGTTRSTDKTIRELLLLKEGDLLSNSKIELSRLNLLYTGYFDFVDISPQKSKSNPNKVKLAIRALDKVQTGKIDFSVGFTPFEAFTFSAGIQKNNINGRGLGAGINTTLSFWRRNIGLDINKPKFLGSNANVGIGFMYSNMAPLPVLEKIALFVPPTVQNSVNLNLRANYNIVNRLNQTWMINYRYDDMGTLDKSQDPNSPDTERSPRSIRSDLMYDSINQQSMSTSVRQVLNFDQTDNYLRPTKGYFASLDVNVGLPLPDQVQYVGGDISVGAFIPIFSENWVLGLYMRGGAKESYNEDELPYVYRQALGYQTFRGFNFSGVGPFSTSDIYDENGNLIEGGIYERFSYRGKFSYIGSAELRMPTPFPKSYGLNFLAFLDFGSAFGVPNGVATSAEEAILTDLPDSYGYPAGYQVKEYVSQTAIPRLTAGVGLLWIGPIGPIRLEFATPIVSQPYDVPLAVTVRFQPRAI